MFELQAAGHAHCFAWNENNNKKQPVRKITMKSLNDLTASFFFCFNAYTHTHSFASYLDVLPHFLPRAIEKRKTTETDLFCSRSLSLSLSLSASLRTWRLLLVAAVGRRFHFRFTWWRLIIVCCVWLKTHRKQLLLPMKSAYPYKNWQRFDCVYSCIVVN